MRRTVSSAAALPSRFSRSASRTLRATTGSWRSTSGLDAFATHARTSRSRAGMSCSLRTGHQEGPRAQRPVQHILTRPAWHVPQHRPRDQGQRLTRLVARRRRPPHPMIPRVGDGERVPGQLRRAPRPVRPRTGRSQPHPDRPRQLRTELPRHRSHTPAALHRDVMPELPLPLAADHQPATHPGQPALHQLLHHAHSPHVEESGLPTTQSRHPHHPPNGPTPNRGRPLLQRKPWSRSATRNHARSLALLHAPHAGFGQRLPAHRQGYECRETDRQHNLTALQIRVRNE